MSSRLCLPYAALFAGLICLVLGTFSAFALKARVKYRDVSGRRSHIVNVEEVKDAYRKTGVSGPNENGMFHYAFKRNLRFARNVPTTKTQSIPTRPINSTMTTNSTPSWNTTPFSNTTPSSIPQNTTVTSFHTYYRARFYKNSKNFEDLKALYDAKNKLVVKWNLTSSHPNQIRFIRQRLKFKSTFYGHTVESVIVTSAGFIHIGPILHGFIHDVHYVAPLMGDFYSNPRSSVIVYIYSDNSKFTAQWESVYESGAVSSKPFTFQVTLYLNGTIVFAYKNIPYSIANFVSKHFPPKVGLADGYLITENYTVIVNGRKVYMPVITIYRYHTVVLEKKLIQSNSAFILSPIPNCVQAKTCNSCFDGVIAQNFGCKWCDKLQLCSDTFDWHRQAWTTNGCGKDAYSSQGKCNPSQSHKHTSKRRKGSKTVVGVTVGIVVAILVLCVVGVLFYGYRRPTSKLGMFMIRNRPSKFFNMFKKENENA